MATLLTTARTGTSSGRERSGRARVVRRTPRPPPLRIAQDPAADDLLGRDPLALLLGMLSDQQFPMERAFAGPRLLADRMGVDALSAADLAAADPEQVVPRFPGPPAAHRCPGSMAARTQAVCRLLVDRYGGRAGDLWAGVPDGATLRERIGELPGSARRRRGSSSPCSQAVRRHPARLAEVRAGKQEAERAARAAVTS